MSWRGIQYSRAWFLCEGLERIFPAFIARTIPNIQNVINVKNWAFWILCQLWKKKLNFIALLGRKKKGSVQIWWFDFDPERTLKERIDPLKLFSRLYIHCIRHVPHHVYLIHTNCTCAHVDTISCICCFPYKTQETLDYNNKYDDNDDDDDDDKTYIRRKYSTMSWKPTYLMSANCPTLWFHLTWWVSAPTLVNRMIMLGTSQHCCEHKRR